MGHGGAKRALVALGLLVATASEAEAAEFHYALIFGADAHPRRARTAHTWAIFVRAVGEGPDPSAYAIETRVISWLPETLRVRTFALVPEPGYNLTIPETFAAVLKYERRVTMWGPFLIDREHFERAGQIAAVLDDGSPQYRALNSARSLEITNCIHAVANVDALFGRGNRPGFRYGKSASRFIAEHVAGQANPGLGDHAWLIPRLGLDQYPLNVVPAWCVDGRTGGPCHCSCPD